MAGESKQAQWVDWRLTTPLPARWQIRQKHVRPSKNNGFRHKPGRLWRSAHECRVSLDRDLRRQARPRYGFQPIAIR